MSHPWLGCPALPAAVTPPPPGPASARRHVLVLCVYTCVWHVSLCARVCLDKCCVDVVCGCPPASAALCLFVLCLPPADHLVCTAAQPSALLHGPAQSMPALKPGSLHCCTVLRKACLHSCSTALAPATSAVPAKPCIHSRQHPPNHMSLSTHKHTHTRDTCTRTYTSHTRMQSALACCLAGGLPGPVAPPPPLLNPAVS